MEAQRFKAAAEVGKVFVIQINFSVTVILNKFCAY